MSSAARAARAQADAASARETAPSERAGPAAPGDPGSQLAREFGAAWRRGECSALEQFLAARPEIRLETAVAVRLVCEEICLRQETGEVLDSAAILARFPQWQAELELLLACYGLFQDEPRTDFPASGEELGEFRLLAELGRGATGRVFLATQPSLSDRPVVVKFTSLDAAEHLSLSRLQHTGIVPLYLVQDLPERGLRALCMPYLGGASLDAVLAALKDRPAAERSGKQLVEALSALRVNFSASLPFEGPELRGLEELSYVQAVCWIGACLADALHYAHQRGLLHLDLKPSNVLLAGDGQPMLLDFHLARGPVQTHPESSDWLGGTAGYMSPEQAAAVAAIRSGSPVGTAVDERSDIFSLGVLLYEMLGGPAADGERVRRPLKQYNGLVTRGLGDLIEKCLARDPSARYADAASLADDLRHELADLPLRGVPNRSLTERWRKWRRRKPQALRRLTASAIVVALGGGAPLVYLGRQARDAQLDLQAAEQLLDRGKFPAAVDRLRTGLGRLAFVPGHADLKSGLQGRLSWAQQRRWAEDLHKLVDQLRFHDSGLRRLPAGVQGIDRSCRTIWQARDKILAEFTASDGGAAEQESRTDLIDLAILWAGLKVRSAAPSEADQARRGALELLDQAEQTFGRSLVLDQERTAYAAATDESPRPAPARNAAAPRSAWEHEALGRFFLHRGRLDDAEQEFRQALQTAPKSFWPNYYTGICAFQADDRPAALTAFSVCVALNPQSAECFFNRGMALSALDRPDDALDDYSRALEIDPRLAAASLYRGMLHRDAEDFEQAANDFEQALKNGAEPSAVHYQWALLHLARHDREAAKASLRAALSHSPQDREARELLKTLE